MAGKAIAEPVLRAELLQYSGQREEFVAELLDALRSCGGEPQELASVAHPTQRDWAGLADAIAGGDRSSILAACETADAAASDAYRAALADEMPMGVRALIHAQLLALTRVKDRIHSLRDALGAIEDQ